MIDYSVHLIKFPSGKIHEATTVNEDGSYTIFLDKNEPYELQRERFAHAMRHITGDDFYKIDIQQIEAEAHEG